MGANLKLRKSISSDGVQLRSSNNLQAKAGSPGKLINRERLFVYNVEMKKCNTAEAADFELLAIGELFGMFLVFFFGLFGIKRIWICNRQN